MSSEAPAPIFAITLPGMEQTLADEARDCGFDIADVVPGGVGLHGGWPEVWRANLELRGATRVLWRMGSFMAFHLAQLDKRARKFPWADVLRPDVPVRVEVATSRKSKIYHAGAATKRIETALVESAGMSVAADAPVTLKVRIDDNRMTVSVDTSGEPLHKRGHKEAVGKAPMRETLAAMFLRQCGFDGSQPVFDPMCGSGTFVVEAAEMAAGLQAGRARGFAFEQLAGFDADAVAALRTSDRRGAPQVRLTGSDRDQGVIAMARANAERAGVADLVSFETGNAGDITPPDGPPGLVIVNPPYGARIGNKKALYPVYGRLGQVLAERFSGWRVGIVTSEASLAKATGLPFLPEGPSIAHGGLRVKLWRTAPLP
ncbi:class I SAM-dependent RNA methyltransferase [Tateyamaria omphalii]|uniref:THUMP domain-containing class I SAM-dependent RNA methyltransferase n=1 Tax=Tateyamaria omphalii TaxID=299262 RepID=UPI001C9A212B|nr:class I SAM-dependent RNA methyltransferase [Tateyamaria omphalii]MBY5935421.1 class I SAM-dependent RNA methyltransferase [Tateyamaria omphalii]